MFRWEEEEEITHKRLDVRNLGRMNKKVIHLRTKTKYVNKPTELRDYKDYWIKRLLKNKPTHFRKHNQHGVWSPVFRIVKIEIVDSPEEYLEGGVAH